MKTTIEQIEEYRRIVADAPKGATHYANHLGYRPCVEEYLRYSDVEGWFIHTHKSWVDVICEIDEFNNIHCLDDLRANIELHDENQKLREALEKIKGMSSMSYHSLESAKIVASNALKELLK